MSENGGHSSRVYRRISEDCEEINGVRVLRDDGNPKVGTAPICSKCENTEIPNGNVEWVEPTKISVITVHICNECGLMNTTHVPWPHVPDDVEVVLGDE